MVIQSYQAIYSKGVILFCKSRDMKDRYVDKAFAKQLASAFIVGSPFQLLCAIEAIHEFGIREYQIAFLLQRESPRNPQMFAMAEKYGVEYDLYYMGDFNNDYRTNSGIYLDNTKQKYDRIFLGDYDGTMYNMLAPIYGKQGAVTLYMDDGNSTVLFLKGVYKAQKPKNWRKKLNWYRNSIVGKSKFTKELEKKYGVHESNCFFTVYNMKSKKFQIYPNELTYVQSLANKEPEKKENAILIVGTSPQVFAEEVHQVALSLMEAIHWQKLEEIRNKYPQERIIYIPHGRDNNPNIPQFCSILNIEYRKIDEPIETYTLKSDINPVAIYGFGSAALMVFHKIFPAVEIISWRIKHAYGKSEDRINKIINDYYKKDGIKEDIIWLPKGSRIEQAGTGFVDNIKSILCLVRDKITDKK